MQKTTKEDHVKAVQLLAALAASCPLLWAHEETVDTLIESMLADEDAFALGIKALSQVRPDLLQSEMMTEKLLAAGIIRKTLERLAKPHDEGFAQDGCAFLNNVSRGKDPEKLGFNLHDGPLVQGVLAKWPRNAGVKRDGNELLATLAPLVDSGRMIDMFEQ